jgi:hypothetical protein
MKVRRTETRKKDEEYERRQKINKRRGGINKGGSILKNLRHYVKTMRLYGSTYLARQKALCRSVLILNSV